MGTRAKMSSKGDRIKLHAAAADWYLIDPLDADRWMRGEAEREARAILAETEPEIEDRDEGDGSMLAHYAPLSWLQAHAAGIALEETLSAFVQS